MFQWIIDLVHRFGEALIPIKRINASQLYGAVKNPIKFKNLVLDEKQSVIIWIHKKKIKIVGGIDFSNAVINPEIGKGWITSDKGTFDFMGKRCYIADSTIPHVLTINEDDQHAQYRVSDKVKAMLGLPKQWIQLQVDMINNMAMSKWNAAFDESRGSVLIWLFGAAVGFAGGVLLTLILIVVLGAALKR